MAPTTTLLIRPRVRVDDPFIARLGGQAFRAYAKRPEDVVRGMLDEPDAHAEVAVCDGEIVGFFVLHFEQLRRDYGPLTRPVVARLSAIAVDRLYRKRGVGRDLLGRALELGARRGALSMFLMTAMSNTRARLLFERAGFDDVCVVPSAYVARQRGVVMTRLLQG